MIAEFERYIKEHHMIKEKDLVLAGVSGGADSVCLLLLFIELQKKIPFTLRIIHVEHGIRGEASRQDMAFVEELCQKKQIPCQSYRVDVPDYCQQHSMGLEEGARKLRYEVFDREVEEGIRKGRKPEDIKIALAHHGDDNAETILFQWIRGSGMTGLCGMKPIRKSKEGFFYIRPLLWASRLQIENYLQEKEQTFCTDSTNLDVKYSRNRLRQVVLPELACINTEAISHINETAGRLSLIQNFMEDCAKKAFRQCVTQQEGKFLLSIRELQKLHKAMVKEVIKETLYEVAGEKKDIASVHIEAVEHLCYLQSGKEVALPYQIKAKREYDIILLEKVQEKKEEKKDEKTETSFLLSSAQIEELKTSGEKMSISFGEEKFSLQIINFSGDFHKISKKRYTKYFDYDMIKNSVTFRNRCSGDYLIMDSTGHRKKLKNYLIEEKVPAKMRDYLPVMAQESLILWVVGKRISEHCKPTEQTQYALKVQYLGGTEDGLF